MLADDLRLARAPLIAFVAMGLFWGAWSALIPPVRAAVGADDAELGRALLCVAAGALPAMLLGGRLADRLGARLLAPSIALFGAAATLPGLATTPLTLAAALLVLGAASGFMDVVMNARVSAREAAHGARLMHLAHGTFALVFFAAATLTGLAREAGASHGALLLVTGALILALAVQGRDQGAVPAGAAASQAARRPSAAVILLGLIVLVAYLAENGLQSWSALHLERSLAAGAALGGLGPGLLELAVAGGRFAGQGLVRRLGDGPLLASGGALGGAGAVLFAVAPMPAAALAGLVLAGAGLSVLAPTAFSLAGRRAAPGRRGADVATASIIGYTGFFLGPAVLGLVAARLGLPAAILAIAGFALMAPALWLMARPGAATAEAGRSHR